MSAPQVFAEEYKVLVLPDNIVTENVAVDSYIYNATAEYFADEIVTILNETDNIKSPTVSEVRSVYKKFPTTMITAKNLMTKFRNSYNVDFVALKKLAQKSQTRYVLMLTSYIDSENYILRRTFWDFLNIPGATVVDPAYKISTYAVLVDTETNAKIWSDTYYKTISVCENRIITRGPSPQTEQLQKIKDYSKLICPQIAQNVQVRILPEDVYASESKQVRYDLGNVDNVFTKKYRYLRSETGKEYQKNKEKAKARKEAKLQMQLDKQQAAEQSTTTQLEVKAQPVDENIKNGLSEITNKTKSLPPEKDAVYKNTNLYSSDPVQQINYQDSFDTLKRTKKNMLYEREKTDRPILRDYYN